jgi:hypothetical protein
MKKSLLFLLAALLVVAFTLPASAFENQFGGYFRMRGFIQQNFDGDDEVAGGDVREVDLRTRLYYTAVFSDNFKFVNKFEIDTTAGVADKQTNGGGIGADSYTVEVKNTYVDFTLGPTRWTAGTQGATIARGFLFSDDFTGIVARFQPGGTDEMLIPFAWIAVTEGSRTPVVSNDVDIYALFPYFPIGIGTINPYIVWHHPNGGNKSADLYWLGVDADLTFDPISVWFTGIYNFGKNTDNAVGDDIDQSGYLLAAGVKGSFDPVSFWVEGFYATGDDDPTDTDAEFFFSPPGSSYYWSEIMGLGTFDGATSAGSPDDNITNILAIGGGAAFGFGEIHKLGVDVWYAQLAEDDANGEKDLGIEIDLKYTIALMENLKLDLIGAYLLAGDATSLTGSNESDPYEIGTQLSLSF